MMISITVTIIQFTFQSENAMCSLSAHCHDRGGRIFYSAVERLSSCQRHLRLIARFDPRWGVFSSLFCFSYVRRLIFCIYPPLPKCSQSLMRWGTDYELLKKSTQSAQVLSVSRVLLGTDRVNFCCISRSLFSDDANGCDGTLLSAATHHGGACTHLSLQGKK